MKESDQTGRPLKEVVLCAVDFSESSVDALQWAAGIATAQDLQLTIIYPYRLNQVGRKEDVVQMKKNIDKEAASNFEKVAQKVLNGKKVPFAFHAEVGFLTDRVQEHSRQGNVRMVVISRKMASGTRDSIHELVDHLHVPLVIVPSDKA